VWVNVLGVSTDKVVNLEHLEIIREAVSEKKRIKAEYYSFKSDETTVD
jgi:predicted DNA-binding transcriptional regulator YafY